MRKLQSIAALVLFTSTFALAQAPVVHRGAAGGTRPIVSSVSRPAIASLTTADVAIPPLVEGVEELKFAEFFKLPVGPRGMEPSEQLKGLEGKKVRLVGYFVFEDWSSCSCPPPAASDKPANGRRQLPVWMKHVVPGRAMIAPQPVAVSLGHYGLSDDLPPQVAFLRIAPKFGEPVFYRPGVFAVTGTLKLANTEEPDGRISYVQIAVENETDIVALGRAQAPKLSVK